MKSLKSFSVTRFSVLMLIISTCATSLTVQGAMIELAQITGPDDKETLAKQEKVINKASVFLEIYKNRLMMDMHQPPHIRPPGVYVIPRDVEWQSAKTYSLLFKHFGRDAVRKIYEFYVGKGGAAQLPKTEIAAKYNVMIASFLAYEAANGPLYTTRDNIVYAKGDERLDLLPLKVRNFLEQNQIKLVQYDHRNPQSKKYLYNYHVPTGTSFPIPHEIEASIWQRNYDSHHYPAQFVTEICCQRQNKNGLDTLFFWNPISQNSRSIALPIEFQKIQATTKFSVQNPTNPNESITLLDESHTHHIPIATIKEVDANTLFLQRGQCHSLRYTKIPYDKENVFTIDKYTGTVVTKKCITQEDE